MKVNFVRIKIMFLKKKRSVNVRFKIFVMVFRARKLFGNFENRAPGDELTTGKVWDEWLEEIEQEFRFSRITDPSDKRDALVIYCGKEIARLEKSLPNPTG